VVLELAGVVHREDVRMVQRRSCLRFALEPPAGGRIGKEQLGKKLDGDRPIQLGIDASVHLSHAARPERRYNFIRPDASANRQGHDRRRELDSF
jgi:hypothetical protein